MNQPIETLLVFKKKKTMKALTLHVVLFFFAFTPTLLTAQFTGGFIEYECVSPNFYLAKVSFYRTCAGPPSSPGTLSISVNGCNNNFSVPLYPDINNFSTEITEVCSPNTPTVCNNGNLPGFLEIKYTANLFFPASPCTDYEITAVAPGLRASTSNMNTTTNQLELKSKFNNVTANCSGADTNSSPVFSGTPNPIYCEGSTVHYNPGVIDREGDSLTFEIVNPTNNTYTSGDSTQPFAGIQAQLDSHTGQLSFNIPGGYTQNGMNATYTVPLKYVNTVIIYSWVV